ncbi:MAG: aspartate kinase [Lentisphaerae bacterium]|jgi:aspartate kinase|nr:aspartate kinase [Lentisphaerota bacterium]MBT4816615.1 aspartate kinase [Lentisphaerota bacterium]MBT5610937.1 aspartate kinase [Lentisphaerota bacterium]MBT7053651.1 aspartate kinase [Lentisphaerota bacterium]MBT7842030.1 aspartate kinase [Lentisphaerota bacterium]
MGGEHTVEKIGGTSMSRFGEVMENVIIGGRSGADLYERGFVVSAYGGITNLLLEDKKTGAPGIYATFASEEGDWGAELERTRERMLEFNRSFADIGLDGAVADAFVNDRMDGIRDCLNDIMRLRSFGHLQPSDYLPATRELLSAVGEAHSAFNSVEILGKHGVNARFVDLTGWRETASHGLDEVITKAFEDVDFSTEMPIITGYVKYDEGIMTRFDRGYSEITFSKVAVTTGAREGIIHKEYHLSTGDPVLMGADNVQVIGHTNFDIADQLSDLDMEAIHSKASKEMELCNIPIRVKNAFEPAHPGTLISRDYVSPEPRVEIICGRDDVLAIEVYDPEMVGECGYDYRLLKSFLDAGISYIAKNTNANTITHFVPKKAKKIQACIADLQERLPGAQVKLAEVAIVCVIGTNMGLPGFLSRAARALAEAEINVLGLDQAMRQVNMQFIVRLKDFAPAQLALHREFVENEG